MSYITFFHNSGEYREFFSSKENDRPCFYWFGDSYHCHLGWDNRDDYFYLFVKNPKEDKIPFRARYDELDFSGLYKNFLDYKIAREEIYKGQKFYAEPSILMSFARVEPDIISKYLKESQEYEILKPGSHKGLKFKVSDEDGRLIPFNQIEVILDIVPQIKNSYPFIEPKKEQGHYIYEDWIPMVTDKNGVWL
ncbi:MAG: hypothetical protein CMI53_04040 [Parcubacteria group bacterium]|nr:hypothetical protein [Parcubacteria group bacterium]